MAERQAKAEFGPKLVNAFEKWAVNTKEAPYTEQNQKEAMEKFQLTSNEFSTLLFLTASSWML